MLSDQYWIKSTCLLYDSDYGIWYKYEEYNNNQQKCKEKSLNETIVTSWDGDIENIEFPDNNITNIEYTCYVTQECDNIVVTTKDKSSLNNPYQWDSTVIYVVTIFIWICATLCIITVIYLFIGYKKSRKIYFKEAWNKIPKMWQCYYYLKHNNEYFYIHCQEDVSKGANVKKAPDDKVIPGSASTKHIASIVFSYWPIINDEQLPKHFEPSKSSKSIGSVNIIYSSDKSRDQTISNINNNNNNNNNDRTASSNKTATREESKSL